MQNHQCFESQINICLLLQSGRETLQRCVGAAALLGSYPLCSSLSGRELQRGWTEVWSLRAAPCWRNLPGGEPGRPGWSYGTSHRTLGTRSINRLHAPHRSFPLQHQLDTKLSETLISAANETTVLETTKEDHDAHRLMGLQGLTSGPTEKHRIQVSFLAAALSMQANVLFLNVFTWIPLYGEKTKEED